MFMILIGVLFSIVIGVAIGLLTQRILAGVAATAILSLLTVVFSSFTVISAGHTGVQVTLGEVQGLCCPRQIHPQLDLLYQKQP